MADRRALLLSIAMVFSAAILFPAVSSACDCGGRPPCHNHWTADTVFIGTVEKKFTTESGTNATQLAVREWFRGEKVGERVLIDSTGAGFLCNAFQFRESETYLVYASRGERGEWRVWACSGTAPLATATAAEGLKYAREIAPQHVPGRMSGFGFIDERPDPNDQSGPPLVGAALRLASRNRTFTTKTDAKGDYSFPGIPPGEYMLHISHPGIQTIPPRRVVVGAEACIVHAFWSRPRQ